MIPDERMGKHHALVLSQNAEIVAEAIAPGLLQIKARLSQFGTFIRMSAAPSPFPETVAMASQPAPVLDEGLLARLDIAGPRYTSYPTADRFVDAFTAEHYRQALAQRAEGVGALGSAAPLSLYVHIPFCESVCYYCACNKVITKHHERAGEYLDALEAEIALHEAVMGRGQPVSQLHLGGGSPTFLSDDELERLMASLRRSFKLLDSGEYAIEVDPRTVTRQRLERLAGMGFNRISLGVQDTDAQVQKAVHRVQPWQQVVELIQAARELKFHSVNVDLIYGLPRQTAQSFVNTLSDVISVRPDRVAIYAYAHLPRVFKPQRRIIEAELPKAGDKISMLSSAISRFLGAGYQYIGMDHFALPDDSLAVAKRQGRLHRNFQGYSTQPDCDIIGLGVSAIGRVGATYSQNAKTLPAYYDAIRAGDFAVARGIALTRDDLLRRSIIMAIMAQGRVDYESIELAHLVDVRQVFAREIEQLAAFEDWGLVVRAPDGIEVTPLGWYFVRAIAMVFDRHLQADQALQRFSRII